MTDAIERRQVRFEGRVQGVFFRATTQKAAERFDVTGWVRNEPDGSVLAEVQGEPGEIDRFLEHHTRVRPGRVDRQSSDGVPVVPGETGFVTRR